MTECFTSQLVQSLQQCSELLPTFAEMRVDAHVPSSARQALVLAVWNVLIAVWINVLLCKTKVNYKYRIPLGTGGSTNEEIFRLDVTVDQQL